LVDARCSAYFDADTGELEMLYLDGWGEEIELGDPSATFDTEMTTFGYNTSDWHGWLTMDSERLGPLDVEDMSFVLNETVPSGRYRTLFIVSDFGEQVDYFITNLTVDNDPPVANAGPDRGEVVNTIIELNASLSTDIGWIDSYLWEFDDGGPVSLLGAVVDYEFTSTGEYDITLTVTDGAGHTDSDTVVITVSDDMPPVADAGPDRTVPEDTVVIFDGANSSDDVAIVNYTWTIIELDVSLYDEVCNFTFADLGVYTIELVVNDTIGQLSSSDNATITVVDVTSPVANAGLDRTVPLGTEVTLNGSVSTDEHGIVNYTWTFTDVDDEVLYGIEVAYTFITTGEHVVTLTVEDAAGNNDTDEVMITVVDEEDPEADAGPDQTVAIGEEVTFDGSNSADNSGTLENYTWTFEYDDDERELYGENPVFTFEMAGEFVVMLTVEDAAGNYDTDTVTIRVNAPPVADAGSAITVSVGEEVTFDGSESTDDSGSIENYTWTFEYDGDEWELYGVSPSFVFEIAGEYTVELTVTDAVGLTDTDEVVVTVEEADGGADEESFLESYWWVLAIIAIVVVAGAASAAMIMSKKGGKSGSVEDTPESKPETVEETDDLPPPPEDL
jgi:PKD repeat protein